MLLYSLSYNNNMGAQLCSNNSRTIQGQPYELQIAKGKGLPDEPSPEVAVPVRTQMELSTKVRHIHMIYKPHHNAERKGIKLPIYYLFEYCAYYDGEWKNGLPHGFGKIIYDDGSVYQGCFKNGVAECKDALFVKDETIFYKGAIKNNKANGYGELTTPKLFYKGNWVDDVPQGKARQIYSSVSFYEGNFLNGEKHGDGIYQWNKNQFYIGKFNKNLFDGEGDLITKQYQYRGHFVMGKKQGKGTYKNIANEQNKFIYTGQFKDDKPCGEGQIAYSDGTVIKGTFDGFENIVGMLTMNTGQTIKVNINPTASSDCDP